MKQKVTARAKAWVAAMRHGMPARTMPVIGVVGRDGNTTTIAYLAQILKAAGERVGIVTPDYIEIANEHVKGSDQAHPFSDAFKLHDLLGQMRRSKCTFVLLALPPDVPAHQFTGLTFAMIAVYRATDLYVDQVTNAAQTVQLQSLLQNTAGYVVLPRDDAGFDDLVTYTNIESRISFGVDQGAESQIADVQMHPKGSAVHLVIDHQTELNVITQLTTKQAVYSVAAAATAAYALHIPLDHIAKGIDLLPPQHAKAEYLPLDRPYAVVLDSSVTPGGIAEVLESLKHFTRNRLIVVVGASLNQPESLRPVVGDVVAEYADRIIVTDGDYTNQESALAVRAQFLEGISRAGKEAITEEVDDRNQALEKALSIARRGDTIVICSVATRPYRQVGADRHMWDDRQKIQALV